MTILDYFNSDLKNLKSLFNNFKERTQELIIPTTRRVKYERKDSSCEKVVPYYNISTINYNYNFLELNILNSMKFEDLYVFLIPFIFNQKLNENDQDYKDLLRINLKNVLQYSSLLHKNFKKVEVGYINKWNMCWMYLYDKLKDNEPLVYIEIIENNSSVMLKIHKGTEYVLFPLFSLPTECMRKTYYFSSDNTGLYNPYNLTKTQAEIDLLTMLNTGFNYLIDLPLDL